MGTQGKVSLTWLDVGAITLLLLAGLGAWTGARGIPLHGGAAGPRETDAQLRHGVPKLQAELLALEAELTATESRIVERRLDATTAEAAQAHPARAPAAGEADALGAARRVVLALEGRRAVLREQSAVASVRVAAARAAAARELAHEDARVAARRAWETRGAALALTGIALLAARLALGLACGKAGVSARWPLVWAVALPVLSVAVAFHSAEWLGAAAAVLALLVVGALRAQRAAAAES
jgi:hypothetical protein